MEAAPPIGIDLGTTNSCVSVMRHGKVEVIANEQGNFITPSYVAFTRHEIIVGDAAKEQIPINPENTVFDVKRMIGRKFDDPVLQQDMQNWPFTVIGDGNEPRIEVTLKGVRKLYAPEEISAMVLHRMKEIAEKYLNKEVRDAVITVPAYFNHAQRQATLDAGEIAGLNVLNIINEPTAAAIAYRYANAETLADGTNILVFDLGGGTFDVSVLKVKGEEIQVLATNGDTHLGGGDFDCALLNHCVELFKRKHNVDIKDNKRAIRLLRSACENAKRSLSSATQREIVIESLADGITFSAMISRAKFDDLNAKLFREPIELVKKALADAQLSKKRIDRVVLVGGSTRIPKVQKVLQEFFGGKNLDISINPDEAVAFGAAVHAAVVKGDPTGELFGKLLQDVTPLSLGEDLNIHGTDVKYTQVVIPRNSPIPCSAMWLSKTVAKNQKMRRITVRQGESSVPNQNLLLGEFDITDLPRGPAGSIKFSTVFQINANGILTVTATETSTGKSNSIKIENVADHSRKERLKKMMDNALKMRMEEHERRMAVEARMALEQECYSVKDMLMSDDVMVADDNEEFETLNIDDVLKWVEENPDESREAYENRLAELTSSSLMDKMKSLFSSK